MRKPKHLSPKERVNPFSEEFQKYERTSGSKKKRRFFAPSDWFEDYEMYEAKNIVLTCRELGIKPDSRFWKHKLGRNPIPSESEH